jgi:hypothetical protein
MGKQPTTIYTFDTDHGSYVGRTIDIDTRKQTHTENHPSIHNFKILATYPTIQIKGYGRLDARMEYLWYSRIKPTLNKVIAGHNYYKRDCEKYNYDVIVDYDKLDTVYRLYM